MMILCYTFKLASHDCVLYLEMQEKNYAVIFLHGIIVQVVPAIAKLCMIFLSVLYEPSEALDQQL